MKLTEAELRKIAKNNPDIEIEGLEEEDAEYERQLAELDGAMAQGRDIDTGPAFKSTTELRAWKEWLPTINPIAKWYEPVRFYLPSRTTYRPDIVALTQERELWFIEVKGSWDAYNSGRAQKKALKEAAVAYAQWGRFFSLIWDSNTKTWELKEYTRD